MNIVEFSLGALFVAINAYERFNTPPTNRSTTTPARYYSTALMYVSIACITFFVFSKYPALLTLIGGSNVPESVTKLPAALVAALVLSVLLDKMPFFAPLDSWLRQKLQHIANIPYEARRLSRRLLRAPFTIETDVRAQIQEILLQNGFSSDDIQFERSESAQHTITKIVVLMDHLRRWEGERKFSGFMSDSADEIQGLKLCCDQLTKKARRCFNHIRDLPQYSSDLKSAQMGNDYRNDLRENAEELLSKIFDFISRGILQCGVAHSVRRRELAALGFEAEVADYRGYLSFHQIVSLFAVTASVLLFGGVIASSQSGASFPAQLRIVIMVATIYCVAIVCALHPKDHWTIARRGSQGERPAAFYAVVGLLAALCGLAVSFIFKLIQFAPDFGRAVDDVKISHPWLLMSFSIAIVTAYLSDNRGTEFGRWQRLVEALIQAVSLVLAAYLTHCWLASTNYFEIRHVDPARFLLNMTAFAALNGFALGFLVPTWYRKATRASSEENDGNTSDSKIIKEPTWLPGLKTRKQV